LIVFVIHKKMLFQNYKKLL